jgi:hypothetical protein
MLLLSFQQLITSVFPNITPTFGPDIPQYIHIQLPKTALSPTPSTNSQVGRPAHGTWRVALPEKGEGYSDGTSIHNCDGNFEFREHSPSLLAPMLKEMTILNPSPYQI